MNFEVLNVCRYACEFNGNVVKQIDYSVDGCGSLFVVVLAGRRDDYFVSVFYKGAYVNGGIQTEFAYLRVVRKYIIQCLYYSLTEFGFEGRDLRAYLIEQIDKAVVTLHFYILGVFGKLRYVTDGNLAERFFRKAYEYSDDALSVESRGRCRFRYGNHVFGKVGYFRVAVQTNGIDRVVLEKIMEQILHCNRYVTVENGISATGEVHRGNVFCAARRFRGLFGERIEYRVNEGVRHYRHGCRTEFSRGAVAVEFARLVESVLKRVAEFCISEHTEGIEHLLRFGENVFQFAVKQSIYNIVRNEVGLAAAFNELRATENGVNEFVNSLEVLVVEYRVGNAFFNYAERVVHRYIVEGRGGNRGVFRKNNFRNYIESVANVLSVFRKGGHHLFDRGNERFSYLDILDRVNYRIRREFERVAFNYNGGADKVGNNFRHRFVNLVGDYFGLEYAEYSVNVVYKGIDRYVFEFRFTYNVVPVKEGVRREISERFYLLFEVLVHEVQVLVENTYYVEYEAAEIVNGYGSIIVNVFDILLSEGYFYEIGYFRVERAVEHTADNFFAVSPVRAVVRKHGERRHDITYAYIFNDGVNAFFDRLVPVDNVEQVGYLRIENFIEQSLEVFVTAGNSAHVHIVGKQFAFHRVVYRIVRHEVGDYRRRAVRSVNKAFLPPVGVGEFLIVIEIRHYGVHVVDTLDVREYPVRRRGSVRHKVAYRDLTFFVFKQFVELEFSRYAEQFQEVFHRGSDLYILRSLYRAVYEVFDHYFAVTVKHKADYFFDLVGEFLAGYALERIVRFIVEILNGRKLVERDMHYIRIRENKFRYRNNAVNQIRVHFEFFYFVADEFDYVVNAQSLDVINNFVRFL